MKHKINPDVDIVMDIIKATLAINPTSKFLNSVHFHYQERGGLSRKQLEGLYEKAKNLPDIPPGKLATLQAIILKKPVKERAPASKTVAAIVTKDTVTEKLMTDILEKYPQHKRVMFLKMKFDNNEPVSALEKSEMEKFHKLLIK
ncbi:hypothetical protein LK994_04150 [Ferruginibacter lapsinanis]|uniref:hypothetical protein n=1 Tax=Ferruginibacter lapsinanis TaxID=563172 RepID=UPI001E351A09|nr:hypothetical protein [Ferruginibacter lapsinanis]UEG50663.1 hypothetical protein LK994_04150 [Ferruginibacter lapsinanis]